MNRVVVTGISSISAAGVGREALAAALRAQKPLGRIEPVEALRGRRREMRLARIPPFDMEEFLPANKLRRMGPLSCIWTCACLLARTDAGLDSAASATAHPKERRGTFLGTGFGCIETTWEYLRGLFRDGLENANPFLFSESVANAPAGHSAIELDTRGASVTFTCGDASAATAVAAGARAIRDGRVTLAYCGGVELFSPPLLQVLSGLGAPDFLGEGCACLTLESRAAALARDARVYAEILGAASASDAACPPTEWSRETAPTAWAMRRAVEQSGSPFVDRIFLQACGSPGAEQAELQAAASVCPHAVVARTSNVFGSLAAAGGINLVGSALLASHSPNATLVSAASWGGSVIAIALNGGFTRAHNGSPRRRAR